MKELPAVQPDPWLSQILEKAAYRVVFLQNNAPYQNLEMTTSPAFYYSKVSVTQIEEIHALENLGFHLVDTNIILDMPVKAIELSGNSNIRFSIASDEDAISKIAHDNFTYTRFHLDNQIKKCVADKIKEYWVRNFYRGQRGDAMVVATIDNVPVGFLQLIYKQQEIIIDLIAVDQNHRRKSIAIDMIAFAMREKKECEKIVVGTQIANIPSLRLYERMGFRMCNSHYVFHYHTR